MSEEQLIARTPSPITKQSLIHDFQALGLSPGQTVLVHSSMSKIGWITGGAHTVILALLDVLGDKGTLMMPTHTAQNTDPANWRHPPVPESWWQIIRDNRPAYDPHMTQTREMGAIPELFRTMPGVKRSDHPVGSFAAIGANADYLTADHHSLEQMFGEGTPIGKLYELDGYVLLLGVGHGNNTSLHLAEYRANFPAKKTIPEGTVMLVDSQRQWVEFKMHDLDDEDFPQIGAEYEAQSSDVRVGKVGLAESRFFRQRPTVDFAEQWMNTNRT